MNSQSDNMAGTVNVVGAGILGLWQALELARAGFAVRLYEKSETPFVAASSWLAGAMLAPYCEAEAAEPALLPLAQRSLALWRAAQLGLEEKGTLVVAQRRDKAELTAFAKRTNGYNQVSANEIAALEPDLAGRFEAGLFYQEEAHLAPREVMAEMLRAIKSHGGEVVFGHKGERAAADIEIDTRGMGAKDLLASLRPVRGEMAVVELDELHLTRPVRLLHPRMPCYIVPWPGGRYMIGATVIESDDDGPVSVRSALELLGAAFSVHPGFGEAKIIELSAGLRPSLPDNLPRIMIEGNKISVNGAYRHGFLLAPLLAKLVSDYLLTGENEGLLFA